MARIRPESKAIRHMLVDEKTTNITLDKPCKLVFEPNGRRHPLIILAHGLEQDQPEVDDPNVLYFGPGLHSPEGGIIELKSNQTLYLAGGAVVQAAVVIEDAENVSIRGRGILCANRWPHRGGPQRWLVAMHNSRDLIIEGIVVRGSYGYTVVPNNCDNVAITDIAILGGRVWNDDGIEVVNSRHITVRDCFIRTDDDCVIACGLDTDAKGSEDLLVESCTLWCDRARVVLLGHHSLSPYTRGVVFRDIDVIHYVQKVFLLEPGEELMLEDVLFEDWRIYSEGQQFLAVIRPSVTQYNITKVPGHVRNVHFKDIKVAGSPGPCKIVIEGCDETHRVDGLIFENVRIGDMLVTGDSSSILMGNKDYIGNVTFRVTGT